MVHCRAVILQWTSTAFHPRESRNTPGCLILRNVKRVTCNTTLAYLFFLFIKLYSHTVSLINHFIYMKQQNKYLLQPVQEGIKDNGLSISQLTDHDHKPHYPHDFLRNQVKHGLILIMMISKCYHHNHVGHCQGNATSRSLKYQCTSNKKKLQTNERKATSIGKPLLINHNNIIMFWCMIQYFLLLFESLIKAAPRKT